MDNSDIDNLIDNDTHLDTEEQFKKEFNKKRESCPLLTASKPVRKAFSDEQITCLCDQKKHGRGRKEVHCSDRGCN